jgi:hypothetical protein
VSGKLDQTADLHEGHFEQGAVTRGYLANFSSDVHTSYSKGKKTAKCCIVCPLKKIRREST